ncbi:MAG: DNA repair exonuclease [Candidatus Pacearchaeota archaeon]|nr:DNA repair exonuclease [Candidatus Pacearchaeota archaeon]
MKFAHLGDCHLGGWRQPEMQKLNLESFAKAIELSIKEEVDFVIIAGDLFDSAYPGIEVLEEAFSQLKNLKEKNIPCYIIAGSHDYSASGKTFLSVLEKAGFCHNLYQAETRQDKIFLNPTISGRTALYGYPGKKTGLEIAELKNIKLQESPLFKILVLHTCLQGAIGSLPIESIKESELPKADYYALGHLHIDYNKEGFVYSGPTFPNNFQELEELKYGTFYIVETSPLRIEKKLLKLKEVEVLDLEIANAITATDKIISELGKKEVKDKIVLIRISGKLTQGKISNIDFQAIENFVKERQAYAMLKSTSQLETEETQVNVEIEDMNLLEEEIIKKYIKQENSKYDPLIQPLINALCLEKQEDETSSVFQSRLINEVNKTLNLE